MLQYNTWSVLTVQILRPNRNSNQRSRGKSNHRLKEISRQEKLYNSLNHHPEVTSKDTKAEKERAALIASGLEAKGTSSSCRYIR